jgi:hypothetical protein
MESSQDQSIKMIDTTTSASASAAAADKPKPLLKLNRKRLGAPKLEVTEEVKAVDSSVCPFTDCERKFPTDSQLK